MLDFIRASMGFSTANTKTPPVTLTDLSRRYSGFASCVITRPSIVQRFCISPNSSNCGYFRVATTGKEHESSAGITMGCYE